jgi:hypothetical protein
MRLDYVYARQLATIPLGRGPVVVLETKDEGVWRMTPIRAQVDSTLSLEFNPQDLWVGLFWKRKDQTLPDPFEGFYVHALDVYLCLFPCLVLHLSWLRLRRGELPHGVAIG